MTKQDNKHSKYSEPTIEWLIDQIAPNKGNSPLLNFNKKRLIALINKEKAKAIEEFTKDKLVVSDFKCGKHGKLKHYEVMPECSKCFNEEAQLASEGSNADQ